MLDSSGKYHKALSPPDFRRVDAASLDEHVDLPFSLLTEIRQIVDDLAVQLGKYTAGDDEIETRMVDLQSRLFKSKHISSKSL